MKKTPVEYPEWVKDEVIRRMNEKETFTFTRYTKAMVFKTITFWPSAAVAADTILKYEKPPVDPDVLITRTLVAEEWPSSEAAILAGNWDKIPTFKVALKALKVGREPKINDL